MIVKQPSDLEYLTFDGGCSHVKWNNLDHLWTCPSCKRKKRELMIWKTNKYICHIHEHHCHSLDEIHYSLSFGDIRKYVCILAENPNANTWIINSLKQNYVITDEHLDRIRYTAKELYDNYVRFPSVIICGHCNWADGAVKLKLKLPKYFSFATWEIAQFIKCKSNSNHEIDYKKAYIIYDQCIINDYKRGKRQDRPLYDDLW